MKMKSGVWTAVGGSWFRGGTPTGFKYGPLEAAVRDEDDNEFYASLSFGNWEAASYAATAVDAIRGACLRARQQLRYLRGSCVAGWRWEVCEYVGGDADKCVVYSCNFADSRWRDCLSHGVQVSYSFGEYDALLFLRADDGSEPYLSASGATPEVALARVTNKAKTLYRELSGVSAFLRCRGVV